MRSIVFDMWTERSIWYLFEFSNRQLSLIFLSFLAILTNLFPFGNSVPVPTYDEFLYYQFFCHCKIAESIQIFHPSKNFDKSTKFCLTTRIPPVHMCVNLYLYQLKLFIKEIDFLKPHSFFIQSHWHCFYSNSGNFIIFSCYTHQFNSVC